MNWSIIFLFAAPFIGGIIALNKANANDSLLKVFLAFAGGYIFSITIIHLLPEIFEAGADAAGIIVLAGFFFQVFITRISDGAEHGHLHLHQHHHNMALPLGLYISMCFHAFSEGLPLGIIQDGIQTNQSLTIGIAMHELPASFALISILKSEHLKKQLVWLLLVVYACMAPIGLLVSQELSSILNEGIYTRLLAFVAGIFLFISTTILFENSENHQFNGRKLIAILGGVTLALVIYWSGLSH
ncbi:MAG: ZIP family metal transporter [Bacteroidia bacterium]|jgi:zinc transporter ZupT|nr:ZIP family metal transporter [Bacteroidia bacterium]